MVRTGEQEAITKLITEVGDDFLIAANASDVDRIKLISLLAVADIRRPLGHFFVFFAPLDELLDQIGVSVVACPVHRRHLTHRRGEVFLGVIIKEDFSASQTA